MDLAAVGLIAGRELRDSLRTRWFVLYTVAFLGLGTGLTYLASSLGGYSGLQGFGRTAAGLVNLVLLVVPLMGLTAGAQAVAAERERGTLAYLLAHPVTRGEVLTGKFLGLVAALALSLALSFGALGLALGATGTGVGALPFAGFVGLTLLLGLVSLALGSLISVLAARTAVALGGAVFVWLGLVFAGDLGLMSSAVLFRLGIRALFLSAFLNPLQTFKVAAVALLHPSLDVLGPVGLYAADTLGPKLLPVLTGVLVLWAAVPLVLALVSFTGRDAA
ncbi:ABC transporter permease subunit [Caldinitratiruptor microaerophilus]|uniref:ABC transporter permease n=1 Tax=Caldinitratiruptor microaerophilus TaxID=671077 RepID=A0AA35CP67_9FIRM|nr:ABC transporter permease [Caldinitratiruptor microaerophilus]BDG62203.1 hypothetical protein caldi_32930 [Caldinitratiruptor microaerophilus]